MTRLLLELLVETGGMVAVTTPRTAVAHNFLSGGGGGVRGGGKRGREKGDRIEVDTYHRL